MSWPTSSLARGGGFVGWRWSRRARPDGEEVLRRPVCRAAAAGHGRSDGIPAGAVDSPPNVAVVLAGQGRLSSCVEAIRLGACDYLTKPFTPAAVRESLARALECCRNRCCPPRPAECPPGPLPAASVAEAERPHWSPRVRRCAAVRPSWRKSPPPTSRSSSAANRARRRHWWPRRSTGEAAGPARPLAHVVCKGIHEAELGGRPLRPPAARREEDMPHAAGLLESARGGTLFLVDVEGLPLLGPGPLVRRFFPGRCRPL